MRQLLALLSLPFLPGCFSDEDPTADKTRQAPGEDFVSDHTVRITTPTAGQTVNQDFRLVFEAGADVAAASLEIDGAAVETTTVEAGGGSTFISLDPGTHNLRLVGLDADGLEVSDHTVRVRVADQSPWVTLTSPSDGATVTNPVRFNVGSSNHIDEIEILADDWALGTVSPGEILTYEFSGTGFEREIDIHGYADGELVATDTIHITVQDAVDVGDSDFNSLVMGFHDEYPTDGSYDYWWPSGVNWGGNPHDIYYLDRLFAAGDPENRSFCVGLTFEVFMRAFETLDRSWGGDGSLNGIDFDELYTFRTDWYVRDLYGRGIVDAMENYGIGGHVADWGDVQPGDFVQFWRNSGSGHNVVFIDWEYNADDQIIGFLYWSTQGSTDGVGYNDEYFGTSGSSVDPNHFYVGRVSNPDEWTPWF